MLQQVYYSWSNILILVLFHLKLFVSSLWPSKTILKMKLAFVMLIISCKLINKKKVGREEIQGQCWFLHSFSALFLPRVLHCISQILATLFPQLLDDYAHVVSLNISKTLAFGASWNLDPKTELVTVILVFFYLKKTVAALIFQGFLCVCVCAPSSHFSLYCPKGGWM